MRPRDLILRCFAERIGDQWQAFCIDLNLAAQGDSLAEVKTKLDAMIQEYMFDAFEGEDSAHAADLFPRPAPLSIRLRYARYWLLDKALSRLSGAIAQRAQRRRRAQSSGYLAFKKILPAHFSAA